MIHLPAFKPPTSVFEHSAMKLRILLLLTSSVLASIPCGVLLPQQQNGRIGRAIVGGNNVTVGKWPWHVFLKVSYGKYYGMCGGTVLSDKWILTAAHCFSKEGVEEVIVAKGISKFVYMEWVDGKNRCKVAEMIPHEKFIQPALTNDIGLLKLETPLVFDHSVSPICLPTVDQPIADGGYAVATGFGTSNEKGTSKELLRETILPIVPPNDCEKLWHETDSQLAVLGKLSNRKSICAGSRGHGTAVGDSGGPLMMKSTDGRWFQLGITSFGSKEHDFLRADLSPNIFTDVRPYCGWIKEKTGGDVECQEDKVTMEDKIEI